MCQQGFTELLGKSCFSFLLGASHPEEMVTQAKALGYQGLALCDVNGLYGVVRGFQATHHSSAFETIQFSERFSEVRPEKFRYSCGTELTPSDTSPVVLLPMNKEGYARLCHLLTLAKRRAPKGFIALALEDILQCNEDLIACPLPPWNEEHLKKLQEAFQDRIYLPVCRDLSLQSVTLYQQALKLEQNLQLSLFATQRPLYHCAERKALHDVLTCVLHKTTLRDARTRLTPNSERHLQTLSELRESFRERPDLLERTLEIQARLEFDLSELRYHYPREYLPAGKTAPEFLRELTEAGMQWRYPPETPVEKIARARKLLEHELSVIGKLGYEDYFLTLWDVCQFAQEQKILFQGRGSAANSIVCYSLGLTNVDPAGMQLLFERFISEERNEPPDIDIDFEHERREEVIQYIYRKYGEKRAAMVCTVICYRSRMAFREVAKVFGVPLTSINSLIKLMGREGMDGLLQATKNIQSFGLSQEVFLQVVRLATELRGFPRHLGIHTGGFVISDGPITDIVPVEKASMDQRYVIQWNKDDINTLKMMKIDVLSLGMLSALKKSLVLMREKKGIDYNLAQIPHDDQPTYQMIQKADTVGVFQIESRAQMSLLPRLKPKCFYDLVIEVAIVRPGPIQGGMVHPFLRRRAGLEKVTYASEVLRPILERTCGVPIFQEQVMQIAVSAAGFTPGEADELRRIMSSSWKKENIMEGVRKRLIDGMISRGIRKEYAEQIYKTIVGFSSYGFPESHSASFALLTYASCYIKCHHPDIFTCALLNSQPMGFYSPRALIADAQRHGVQFQALDVQKSSYDYELEEPLDVRLTDGRWSVRTGLRSVYGLSRVFAEKIVAERQRQGPFQDLSDLVQRTRLPRAALLLLATAGAFECFSLPAREALWKIQSLNLDAQKFLFGQDPYEAPSFHETYTLPAESAWERVQREYHSKGFALDSHPLAVLRPHLAQKALPGKALPYTTARQLEKLRHNTRLRIAGFLSLLQKPPTAKGFCFLSVEDETGMFNVILKPDIYQKFRTVLLTTRLLEVDGILESREGVRNVQATALRNLIAEV